MWVFLILASLGFMFMLYALIQFLREGKRTTSKRKHSSDPNTGKPQTGPVRMDSVQLARNILLPRYTPPNGVMVMGKFISGLLALMVVWSCAAYRQATANVRLEHGIDDSRGPGV